MKQKYYDSSAPFSGHIRCYDCNKFGHVAKECRKKSMDHHRQHGKKSYKNSDVKRPDKYGSTNISRNKQKEEEKRRCGLSLYTFIDEDEWYINIWCSRHMTGDKNKFESLSKKKYGKAILGNSTREKVLGKGRAKINKYRRAVDTLLVQGLK